MSDKKHIDRLFQEKLKEFEATPNDAVWANISNKLNKDKDDRKVIPFWWKFAGVAAALLLLLTVGNLVLNDSSNTTKVVDTENVDSKNTNKQTDEKSTPIVENDDNENLENNANELSNQLSESSNKEEQSNIIKQSNKEVANTDKPTLDDYQTGSSNKESNANETSNKTNYLVNNQTKKSIKLNEKTNEIVKTPIEDSTLKNEINKEVLTENNLNLIEKNIPKNIINNIEEEELVVDQEKEKIPLTEDVIVSNENINEEEKEVINRWQINPNVAPVYFSSLGNNGSSIDGIFNNNSKSGKINLSYGINTSYAINKRFTVRTGINKVNLSYQTKDIITLQAVSSNSSSATLRNVKFSNNSQNVMFLNSNSISLAQAPSGIASTLKASLDQELGFIEVPLELKYNVINKKFGVNVIGGFSMLFLNNNEIYSVINEVKTLVGEATNINNTSYSANFGLGLDYNISKSVNLNFDPMFKYQINTFNNTSGDFKPYFIGVYSGINIKF